MPINKDDSFTEVKATVAMVKDVIGMSLSFEANSINQDERVIDGWDRCLNKHNLRVSSPQGVTPPLKNVK